MREPPHSNEAEMAVVGALLLNPWDAVSKVQQYRLQPEAFYDRRNKLIFESFMGLASDGRVIDALTFAEHLKNADLLDKCGGYDYLEQLQNPGLIIGHVEEYCDLVRQAWIKRSVLEQLKVIEAEVWTSERGDAALKRAPEHLMGIVDEALQEKTLSDHIDGMMEGFEQAAKGEKLYGLPLPWDKLNEVMCGIPVGLGFIAARPSMGKTTVEDILSCYWASQGIPGARITQDMTTIRLLQRAASRMAGVSLPKIKKGYVKYGSKQWDQLVEASDLMRKFPLHINDSDPNVHQLCTWIRMLKMKHDIKFVTIDYIQQLETGTRLDLEENMRIQYISRKLKALANELQISIIALSQLNRGNAKEGRKPSMSDMRGSGSLEQDAQWVWLLYKDQDRFSLSNQDEACVESKTLRPVWIELGKQQDGECAAFPFWMFPNYFELEMAEEVFGADGSWTPFGDLSARQAGIAADVAKQKELEVEV